MIEQEVFEEKVRILALENALQFKGEANPKALIGKSIAIFPEMKKEMGTYVSMIENVVESVNSLSQEEQKKELMKISPESFEKKEPKEENKKDGLPVLENTENVVVRFEPAPSGYLHLGHLFGLVANYELKKKFSGKIVVRIADTNPDNIALENYDKVIEDVNWICENDIDIIEYQSRRIPIYYKYLTTLVDSGNAYVCRCDGDTFKAYTDARENCPHAKMSQEEQDKLFKEFMNDELERGTAVVRFRADITHKNPAMRSFSLARINTTPHPNADKNYHVWPTMNLAVAVDDVMMGITHVVRGKDHEINMERQKLVHKALGMKSPEYFHFGRMKFTDLELSKSDLSKKIEEGIYEGWDDPRVPSLASYRKRGFLPKAMRNYILSLGISKRDSKITSEEFHKGLYYYNKQLLEPTSKHYFFVHNPKSVTVVNIDEIEEKELEIQKHPENHSLGKRIVSVSNSVFIDSLDFDNLNEGDIFRLMHFGNFEVKGKSDKVLEVKYISRNYDKSLPLKRNIQFVHSKENDDVEIVLQDNSKLLGVCEKMKINEGETIQFERFGFVTCTLNEESKKEFYFAHS